MAARRAGGFSALAATLVAAIALGVGAAGERALFAVPAAKYGLAALVAVLSAAYLVLVACASALLFCAYVVATHVVPELSLAA